MSNKDNRAQPLPPNENVPVMIEVRIKKTSDMSVASRAKDLNVKGLKLDESFIPVPIDPHPEVASSVARSDEKTVIIRGEIPEAKIKELESNPQVVKVWKDTPIAPFSCPIPPCDCTFGNPAIGDLASVATFLGVDRIWAGGKRGTGIVIGIVDGGITAIGRTPRPGEVPRIARVIGGFPADWGTTSANWGEHGNMTSTDALGMAPDAQVYDIRISDGGTIGATISNALAGFDWAINQHRSNGTPQILSNSWGIFQESWDTIYARDPSHPFTRKVIEAINEGIIVLFAAGNCGASCPDGRCGPDNGPGRSIWGANGHPRVITVGAVNQNDRLVGYSSQGPAALDPNKPDFCSVTHFAGYFPRVNPAHASDGGTSAATPIAAGVIALFKQCKPTLTHDEAKNALKGTARDIGPTGWDQHSGSGIINAKAAYDSIIPKLKFKDDVVKFKFRDDGKLKVLDDSIKLKFKDDIKLKFVDDVKFKAVDDGVIRSKEEIMQPRWEEIRMDRFSKPSSSPFILSTPHHSTEWAQSYSQGGQYQDILVQYESAIVELESAINQKSQEIDTLQSMYSQMVEEYKAILEETEKNRNTQQ